jgi:hypothetical protein
LNDDFDADDGFLNEGKGDSSAKSDTELPIEEPKKRNTDIVKVPSVIEKSETDDAGVATPRNE